MRRRRYGRRKMCAAKVRHPSRAKAAAHLRQLLATGDTGLAVYPCQHCGAWHVGHHYRTR